MIRAAINGFGRIGRCVLRAIEEWPGDAGIEVVAINELADRETIAYLTRYDSTHGRFPGEVVLQGSQLAVNERLIDILQEEDIARLPWARLDVDIVFECTGGFSDRQTAQRHIASGARRVLFSQPAERDVDATVVYGVNHEDLTGDETIVSAASCTTNALVPVVQILDEAYGIEAGLIRTIHAAMHDQPVIDAYHNTDLRKTRAAFESMIPIETELARGVERIFPRMQDRFQAKAIRVPLSNVSSIDLDVALNTSVTVEQINGLLQREAASTRSGVLGYTDEPLASCDFVHDRRSGIVDASQTSVAGSRLAKLLIWFDNEWGYANRMIDVARYWVKHR